MADWLASTARALAFYCGVTQLIVPDNPKAMISDANRYEPCSNDTVHDFARHYGTSILPAHMPAAHREVHACNDRKLVRLLKNAHLKYWQAAIEDNAARAARDIDRREVMSLALGEWVSAGHSVLVTGPTGAGKSWLACALAQYACRRGYSAIYQRVPRLQEEPRIRYGSGAFGK